MKNYRVVWEIDIEAETPRDAAELALEIQRNNESIATVFEVIGEKGTSITVDLEESENID